MRTVNREGWKHTVLGPHPRLPRQPVIDFQVQEASPELSPEERRVLERKLKKERKKEEKKRLREAGIAAAQTAKGQTLAAKPSAAVLALEYLQG